MLSKLLSLATRPVGAPDGATVDLIAFHDAVRRADVAGVKALLGANPQWLDMADTDGFTALHWAARGVAAHARGRAAPAGAAASDEAAEAAKAAEGDCEAILLHLLQQRANTDLRTPSGDTALHLAVREARSERLARALLQAGSPPDARDAQGNTALHWAVLAESPTTATALIELLLERGGPGLAAMRNHAGETARGLLLGHAAHAHEPDLLARLEAAERDVAVPTVPLAWVAPPSAPPWQAWMASLASDGPVQDQWWCLEQMLADWCPRAGRTDLAAARLVLQRFAQLANRADAAALAPERIRRLPERVACAADLPPPMAAALRQELAALYAAVSGQWLRAGCLVEAIGYACHARRLAGSEAPNPGDEALRAAERAAIRRQLCAADPASGADGAAPDYAELLLATLDPRDAAGLDQQAPMPDGLAPWLAYLDRLTKVLRQAARAVGLLSANGLTGAVRQNWDQACCRLPLGQIGEPLERALSWALWQADPGPFAAVAHAVQSLATAAALHGVVTQARGWCRQVLDARIAVRATAAVRALNVGGLAALEGRLARLEVTEVPPIAASAPALAWHRWQPRLAALRAGFAESLAALPRLAPMEDALACAAPLPIDRLQQQWSEDIRVLLSGMVQHCQDCLLIDPPCPFAVVGLGSMSRRDMAPYSDLEYVILVGDADAPPAGPGGGGEQGKGEDADRGGQHAGLVDPLARAYFDQLASLFNAAVLALGETPLFRLPAVQGLRIDPGVGTGCGDGDMINTPRGLARVVFQRSVATFSGDTPDQGICYSLLSPSLIHGSELLLQAYLRELDAQRLPGWGRYGANLCQRSALWQLRADMMRLRSVQERWTGTPAPQAVLDLKHDFVNPLNHALTTLGLVYGIAEREPRAILQRLARCQYLAAPFLAEYRWALATLQAMRCRHQARAGEDAATIQAGDLSDGERADLQAIVCRVLQPLWRWLGDMMERDRPARKAGDSDPATALLRDFELQQQRDPALHNLDVPGTSGVAQQSGTIDTTKDVNVAVQIRADITDDMMRSAIATLAHRRASPEQCLPTYRRLMDVTLPQHYWLHWCIWRDAFAAVPGGDAVRAALSVDARPDGWRAQWEEDQRHFYRHLSAWLEPIDESRPLRPGEVRVRALDLAAPETHRARSYLLAPAIAAQLLADGRFIREKRSSLGGRHVVVPIRPDGGNGAEAEQAEPTWWIKFAPENPATERLVHALDCRLGDGRDTPMSLLVTLTTGSETVVAQIMSHVAGANLHTVLQQEPGRLDRLDRASMTRTLLRVLLINPEDDRGDDYRLATQADGSERLGRLDNERAFFAIEKKGKFSLSPTLQVKSQLYCLDQMREPLDADVLADFVRREPLELLRRWIDEAVRLANYFRTLLTEDMVVAHYRRDQTSFLVVGMSDKLEHELHTRLELMQNVIRRTPKGAPPRDGMTLLHTVQPRLCEIYQHAFLRYPPDGSNRQAWPRFRWLTDGEFGRDAQGHIFSTTRGDVAISASLGNKQLLSELQVRAIWYGSALSPTQARERLRQLELHRVGWIVEAVCDGQPGAVETLRGLGMRQRALALRVVREDSTQALARHVPPAGAIRDVGARFTDAAQRRLLKALAGTEFSKLSLGAFARVLTDDLLIPLLAGSHAHLLVLDLQGCWRLTPSSLAAMVEHCPNLEVLRMNRLVVPAESVDLPLPAIRKPALSFGELRFARLRELDVSDSPGLTAIDISAPGLIRLAIDRCSALTAVHTGSTALRELSARACTGLEEAAWTGITEAWHCVERIELANCAQLRHHAFRQRFPWLADYGWNAWADAGLADLARCLARGSGEPIILPPTPARMRVREWLWARDAAVDALLEGMKYSAYTALVEEMRDTSAMEAVYRASAVALGSVGAEWRDPVFSALSRALVASYFPQPVAAEVLGRVGMAYPEKLLPTLLPLLSPQAEPRLITVARHLMRVEHSTWSDMLHDRVIVALARIGTAHPELVIAALKEARSQGDATVRQNAMAALERVGSAQPDPVVAVLLHAPDYDWHAAVSEASALLEGRVGTERAAELIHWLVTSVAPRARRMVAPIREIEDILVRVGMAYPQAFVAAWTQHQVLWQRPWGPSVTSTVNGAADEMIKAVLYRVCQARPAEAIPTLARLRGLPPTVQSVVTFAVSEYGGGMQNIVIPALLNALCHRNDHVRWHAAHALRLRAATHHDDVWAAMASALADSDASTCVELIQGFRDGGVVLSPPMRAQLLATLSHPSEQVRAAAAMALGLPAAREDGPVISALSRAVKDPRAVVRAAAVAAIGQVGAARFDLTALLSDALRDVSEPVRVAAARALAAMAHVHPALRRPVMETCLREIGSPYPDARAAAARVLGQFATVQDEPVIHALSVALADGSDPVRAAAARALRLVAPELLDSFLPRLQTACIGATPAVHVAVQEILERYPASGSARNIDAVIDAMADDDADVRAAALDLLRRVDSRTLQRAVPRLAQLLCRDKDRIPFQPRIPDADREALAALFVGHPEPLIAELLPAVYNVEQVGKDTLENRRALGMRVLKTLYAAQPERVMAALMQAIDTDAMVWRGRIAAAEALVEFGNPAPQQVAAALLWAFSPEYLHYLAAVERAQRRDDPRGRRRTAGVADTHGALRARAADLLAAVGAAQPQALVAAMSGTLRDARQPSQIRAAAATVLGEAALSVSERNIGLLLQ